MMNFVSKTRNFVFKMMNFVLKMMNFADGHGRYAGAWSERREGCLMLKNAEFRLKK